MRLQDALDSVCDAPSFLAFARLLAPDRAAAVQQESAVSFLHPPARNRMGWHNNTISAFLAGGIAWGQATGMGLSQGLDAGNPWKQFALFLYCGKIYE